MQHGHFVSTYTATNFETGMTNIVCTGKITVGNCQEYKGMYEQSYIHLKLKILQRTLSQERSNKIIKNYILHEL